MTILHHIALLKNDLCCNMSFCRAWATSAPWTWSPSPPSSPPPWEPAGGSTTSLSPPGWLLRQFDLILCRNLNFSLDCPWTNDAFFRILETVKIKCGAKESEIWPYIVQVLVLLLGAFSDHLFLGALIVFPLILFLASATYLHSTRSCVPPLMSWESSFLR